MLAIIRSNETAGHWPTLEAALFVMSSVARYVDVYDDVIHYQSGICRGRRVLVTGLRGLPLELNLMSLGGMRSIRLTSYLSSLRLLDFIHPPLVLPTTYHVHITNIRYILPCLFLFSSAWLLYRSAHIYFLNISQL